MSARLLMGAAVGVGWGVPASVLPMVFTGLIGLLTVPSFLTLLLAGRAPLRVRASSAVLSLVTFASVVGVAGVFGTKTLENTRLALGARCVPATRVAALMEVNARGWPETTVCFPSENPTMRELPEVFAAHGLELVVVYCELEGSVLSGPGHADLVLVKPKPGLNRSMGPTP